MASEWAVGSGQWAVGSEESGGVVVSPAGGASPAPTRPVGAGLAPPAPGSPAPVSPSPAHRERGPGGEGQPKTVFLCVPSGTAAANLLRTNVFRLLRESSLVGKLVVLSPLAREAAFRDEHAGPKTTF